MESQLSSKSDDNGLQQIYSQRLEFDNQSAKLQNGKNQEETSTLSSTNKEEENAHESGVESDNDFGADEENWDDDTILSIINGSNRPIKSKTPSIPTPTMSLSFSKLHFVRRFQPLWQENSSFMEPRELPIEITTTKLFTSDNFIIWRRYSESIDSDRRESAANSLHLLLSYIENTSNWPLFFKQLERFMTDEKADIIKIAYRQIPEIAKFLKDLPNENHYMEFNMCIPGQLMEVLLKRCECQKAALTTVEQLTEQNLLKNEVIQNTIIPGLLYYLNDAADKVYRYERMVMQKLRTEQQKTSRVFYSNYEEDSRMETITERDCLDIDCIIFGIFSIFSTILSHISTIDANEQFVTQFIEYIADPINIPILKSVDSGPIREILAGCLAPLAKLMGTSQTDAKLLPIFQRFMREKPEVQCAALRQLADFISVLSKENQELLLPELSQLVTLDGDSRSWRQRAEFAEQLVKMVNLFSINLVNNYICPFALAFSADRISEVRYNGISMLATVLAAFIKVEWGGEMPLTKQLMDEIRVGFLNTRDWRRKQSFGRLIHLLIIQNYLDDEQFCHFFTDDIIAISNDPIANVRQYFCYMAHLNQFPDRPIGKTMRIRLEEMVVDDPDMEICNLAKIVLGIVDPKKIEIDLTGREERLA